MREPVSGNRKEAYTTYNFGDLLSLHMLETRLVARDKQLELAPTNAEVGARITEILSSPALTVQYATTYSLTPPTGPTDVAGITAFSTALGPIVFNQLVVANVTAMYSGNRNLLGATQLAWLQGKMAASTATYQVLGQQVLMGNMTMPAELLIELATNTVKPATIAKYATPIFKLANGIPLTTAEQAAYDNASPLPYNSDAWDGYGRERETILQTALGLNKKLVVFAGDTHNAWANQLKTFSPTGPGVAPKGTVAGIELATPGVSSPGIEKYFPGQEGILRDLFLGYSPGLKFANLSNRGYLDVTFTHTSVDAKFHFRERNGNEWKIQPITSTDAKGLTIGAPSNTTESDADSDGLNDWREFVSGTSSTIADSDADGVNDSSEFANVLFGFDPRTPNNLQSILAATEQRGKDAVVKLHKPDPALNQPPRIETLGPKRARDVVIQTIEGLDVIRLFAQIHRLRRGRLHPIGKFIRGNAGREVAVLFLRSKIPAVQLLREIKDPALVARTDRIRPVEIENRSAACAQFRGRKNRRKKAIPIRRRPGLQRPVAHHHVAWEILRLRAQPIGAPGTEAWPAHLPVAAVHQVEGG